MMLSDEQRRILRAVFPDRPDSACRFCGGYHLRSCPRIKIQEWVGEGAGTGNVVKVEFWPSGQYDDDETIYPEDVFDEDEDE